MASTAQGIVRRDRLHVPCSPMARAWRRTRDAFRDEWSTMVETERSRAELATAARAAEVGRATGCPL